MMVRVPSSYDVVRAAKDGLAELEHPASTKPNATTASSSVFATGPQSTSLMRASTTPTGPCFHGRFNVTKTLPVVGFPLHGRYQRVPRASRVVPVASWCVTSPLGWTH